MLYPVKVVDIELSKPIPTFEGLDDYMALKGLVRLHGVPIGYIQTPLIAGSCPNKTIAKLILDQLSWKIVSQLLQNGLANPPGPDALRLEDLFDVPPPQYNGTLPLVTVAVCTRDRPDDLALCLDALSRLDYPHLDILIVDNAPATQATQELVKTKYSQFRYVCEPRPGLDWARNRAILEAKGEIVAYTDDDVIVDAGWVKALANLFAEHPEVMAVTGLVVPYELENQAQMLFEANGGFGRGFDRKWYRVAPGEKMNWGLLGTGQFGTGANMAYRRSLFDEIGHFDPALDVGTVTNGGGDLEMFFRVIKEGHTLVYEPSAMVRHRHRREYAKLQAQIANNGIALYSYFVCGVMAYPDEFKNFLRLGSWWLWYGNLRRLWMSWKHPTRLPKDLILGELKGSFIGLTRYQKARKIAKDIAEKYGPQVPEGSDIPPVAPIVKAAIQKRETGVAVRSLELSQPIQAMTDIADYSVVRIFLKWQDRPLCSIDLPNPFASISKTRLIESVVDELSLRLLDPESNLSWDNRWHQACSTLLKRYQPSEKETPGTAVISEGLSPNIPVSIVVATLDRPTDLRNCLQHLFALKSPRPLEIVVVDNNPASGLTPPIVAEFPGVVLVNEPRKGLAYARNAGFTASTGDICVATDDDVTVPPDWLEKLVAPFARSDVAIVTGNVLPIELETSSQYFFETYGGLGRGFDKFEVNGDWLESFPRYAAPTWTLGATANAAFRATLFTHPQIGLMYEALGPGMPSGVGEDTYLFYKALKAGYTLVYEPTAYVWHKHRSDIPALRRQLYSYSKGHVSYHLTTWLEDGDWRGLYQLFVALPVYYLRKIVARLRHQSDFPIPLTLLEISGNLAGPWSLWQSHLRVRREGRSTPYIPVSQRPGVQRPLAETLEYAISESQSV